MTEWARDDDGALVAEASTLGVPPGRTPTVACPCGKIPVFRDFNGVCWRAVCECQQVYIVFND